MTSAKNRTLSLLNDVTVMWKCSIIVNREPPSADPTKLNASIAITHFLMAHYQRIILNK